MTEQLVLIVLKFPPGKFDSDYSFNAIWKLQDLLEEEIERRNVGRVDGHEFSDDELIYYIYGPSANKIAEAVKPQIVGLPYLPGSYIVKRYGRGEEDEIVESLATD